MKVRYKVNDKVVFDYQGKKQIGVITNERYSHKAYNYDLRAENGSGFICVFVDKKRQAGVPDYPIIDSKLTEAWNEYGSGTTNLWANHNIGHTRASYPEGTELLQDGDVVYKNNIEILVNHIERHNNLTFLRSHA